MITSTVGVLFDLNDRPLTPNPEDSSPSTLERLALIGKEIPLAADRWRVSLLLQAAGKALRPAMEQRQALYQKHGKQDGDKWKIEGSKFPAYFAELQGLRDEKVELPIQPLRMELFDGTIINALDLIKLSEGGFVLPPKEEDSK